MTLIDNKKTISILNFGDITQIIKNVVESNEWQTLQEKFNYSSTILVVGHGGNLAIADHVAVDITRLTKYKKSTICPGSAILGTSYINDTSFDDWMAYWLRSLINTLDTKKTLGGWSKYFTFVKINGIEYDKSSHTITEDMKKNLIITMV